MTVLVYAELICVFVLFLVAAVVLMRAAARRSPAFARWLDERFGEDSGW